ncbi:MAG: shikimate kinase, partial [Pseudomonadota bacterium]
GFREREQQVVQEMTQWDKVVLATGGGVVVRSENRNALAARGFVVYLYATVDEQVRRTRRDRRRPLLQRGDPEEILRKLMEVRDPLYKEIADHIIETDGCSPRTVAQRLVKELQSA